MPSTVFKANLICRARSAWQVPSSALHHASPTQRSSGLAYGKPLSFTLGVTRKMSVKLTHRPVAPKPSTRAVQCVFASAELHVRAMPTLRPRPEERPFVAVAEVVGYSPEQATCAFRNHCTKASQAQLVPALARRRRQMLVSLWALPLSESRRGLGSMVQCGSGLGSIQAVPRLPTVVTPNPSIEGTVKRLRLSPAPHVKRWASQGTSL